MGNNRLGPIEVQVDSGKVSLKSPDLLPGGLRNEVQALLTILNLNISQGILKLEDVDLGPMVLTSEEIVVRGKPCNWEGFEKKWWGVRAYLSRDTVFALGMGDVLATGIAAIMGGGPIALLIGAAVMASLLALSACVGDCGVEVDVTWAGIPKKIRGRN